MRGANALAASQIVTGGLTLTRKMWSPGLNLLLAACLALAITACGQTGGLYMPGEEQSDEEREESE
jgi:hypothetical protein